MDYLIIFTLLLAPAYAVRFSLFGFPTNLLMVWVLLVWLIVFAYLIKKKQLPDLVSHIKSLDKKILWLISLFFISGIISLFIRGLDQKKLGQFIVLFLQSISLFFIFGYIFWKNPEKKSLLLSTCYLLLAVMGLYAIVQYFTLLGLPAAYWGNSIEPKRAVAFFSHPNFYALFATPLLALLIPDLGLRIKDKGLRIFDIKLWAWLFGLIGLFLSMSRAGWLGLAVAVLIYLVVAADKKIRKIIFGIIVAGTIVIVAVPNWRYRVLMPFYGEKSASSRVELWASGWKGIKQSPIFGLGLNGYQYEYRNLQINASFPDHNFPHNIFLNFWVEAGLLGLISITGLIALMLYRGLKDKKDILRLGISLFLIALVTQGLIDNPYFKNDLAIIFWAVLSLAI